MLRTLGQILAVLILAGGGAIGLFLYQQHNSAAREVARLQARKQELETFVQRLSGEKRVADVLVTKSETIDGIPNTTLLFVEYDKRGQPLPAKTLTVRGSMIHFDALVIKFDRDFVIHDDPLRGHSIALFTRVYGDHQSPDSAMAIDQPGSVPEIYRGADERVTAFEQSLWKNFWRLADDPEYRKQFGVRVANGQGVWGPLVPNKLYTLTLESSGGLNLASSPMRGIYREALQQSQPGNATPAAARIN
jgi:hypothetical protein